MKVLELIFHAVILCISASSIFASSGDRDTSYRDCVQRCADRTGCANAVSGSSATAHGVCPLSLCQHGGPVALRVFRWDCLADCKYHCMHALETLRKSQGFRSRKYHGKWPFVRVAGMQEFFSVLMSLGNLLMHMSGTVKFLKTGQHEGIRHYGAAWKTYMMVSCSAWIASAVFHARDTSMTERLDYMAAFATVVTGFAVSVIRCFSISGRRWQLATGAVFFMMWLGHMSYMLRIKFDYGWNMQLCVTLGLLQAMLWISWSQISRHPARGLLLTFALAVNGAMLFELLDFNPMWGIIDAHSIWHALTVPLTPLWYRFMIMDTTDLATTGTSKTQ